MVMGFASAGAAARLLRKHQPFHYQLQEEIETIR
jgi:N-formylglutamate amidohydrolase